MHFIFKNTFLFNSVGRNWMCPKQPAVWQSIPEERGHCLSSQQAWWSLSLSLFPLYLVKQRGQYDLHSLHWVLYWLDVYLSNIFNLGKASIISPSRNSRNGEKKVSASTNRFTSDQILSKNYLYFTQYMNGSEHTSLWA